MSSTPQLSPRDVTLLAFAFQSLKDDSVLQIDYAKLAELAGYKTAASACACFCTVKKKLMGSASVADAATGPSPKKSKGKAGANGDAEDDDEVSPKKAAPKKRGRAIKTEPAADEDAEDDDEVSPKKAAPKKRGKAIKTEPADVEGADADTEVTPAAETPKKGRAKKGTGTGPSNTDLNGDGTNDTAATEIATPTPKRKRGPNKPKDPNATPTKRAKKGANAAVPSTGADEAADDAAAAQLPGDEDITHTYEGASIFGGDANVKEDQEDGHDALSDAEGQVVADDALHY